MAEEAVKETPVNDPPGWPPKGLASQEFFFLLQRIDRLDEKLTNRLESVGDKLNGRIDALEEKLGGRIDNLRFWTIGAVIILLTGFAGIIITLAQR